jgi:Guanosine polyphosphate pyrophosphohydrolases/synthetases
MLRAAPNLDATAVATRVAAAPALVRKPIRTPADYGVPLPEWLQRCIEHVPPGQGMSCPTDAEALLASAFDFAYQLHEGQFRVSGEPYIIHPVAVADLLRDIGASAGVIAAGFLHDVVEDTEVTAEEIEQHFGAEVRALVEGVTKLGGIHFTNHTEAQAENLRRMFLAMASDIRVVLVKLADRLHNMRTIAALKPEKQLRIARETREIYAPLANRLGIGRLKWELEDLAFKILEPEAYRDVQQQVATKRSEREERLEVTVQLLRDRLAAVGLAHCEVSGRPKHLYGIWSKMQRQQKAFHEIYDVAALRILCPNFESCYRALAVVHDTFRPIPGALQGLHRPAQAQWLPIPAYGGDWRHRPIEVQIRTTDMHQVAEYGIAAHGNTRRAVAGRAAPMPSGSTGCDSWLIGRRMMAAPTATTSCARSKKIYLMRRCLCLLLMAM